jgi:uncharacterized protein (TIGR00369 family)
MRRKLGDFFPRNPLFQGSRSRVGGRNKMRFGKMNKAEKQLDEDVVKERELAPKFKSALLKKAKSRNPFWGLIGMELVDVKIGWSRVRLPFKHELTHALGIAHGGSLFSLADTALAMALLGMVRKNERFTTIEMKINFINAFKGGESIAEATIVGRTRKTAVGEVRIKDSKGKLLATALGTYMLTGKASGKDPRRGLEVVQKR